MAVGMLACGALGGLAYKLYETRRDVDKLKLAAQRWEREPNPASPRRTGARPWGGGRAERLTDRKGNVFAVYVLDLDKTRVKIYDRDESGDRFRSFERLQEYLAGKDETLLFATNGGMFTPEGRPVGLLVVNSQEVAPLDLGDGDPSTNFYLKPNGVFAITDREAVVMESTRFNGWAGKSSVTFATQSGPMLLVDGAVHPKFEKQSSNLKLRSGVGVISQQQVVFAISEKDVNFYDFAMLFQQLKCKNALFLDGVISRMYLPALERDDLEGDFGSIIAVSR